MLSKLKFVVPFGVLLISGCATSLNELIESDLGVELNPQRAILTDRKIEGCWKASDLPGEGYQTLTPSEAIGLPAVEGASDEQLGRFKNCLVA